MSDITDAFVLFPQPNISTIGTIEKNYQDCHFADWIRACKQKQTHAFHRPANLFMLSNGSIRAVRVQADNLYYKTTTTYLDLNSGVHFYSITLLKFLIKCLHRTSFKSRHNRMISNLHKISRSLRIFIYICTYVIEVPTEAGCINLPLGRVKLATT
jgi:hypothetical protein